MPTLQEQAVKMTNEAVRGLFRSAQYVPADNQNDWKPMGEARSTLSQLIECAVVPYFFASLLKGEATDMSSPEVREKRKALEAAITSVAEAEEAAKKSYAMLCGVIAQLSDEDLEKPCPVPWDASPKVSDVIFYPYWNIVYHTGQINYIQLLLGDTDMHM